MGVLVFVMAIIPASTDRSIHILRAEVPGPIVGKLVPKMRDTAIILYLIYIVLTVIEFILLLAGGMPLFDSIVHSFATAGTGGFGIKNDSFASYSPYIQWVVTAFMFLFGVNFNLYYLVITRKIKSVLKSEELRVYVGLYIVAIVLIGINISGIYDTFNETVRHSAFQVATVISTAGFSTADFNQWPELSKTLILILMFVGSCAGSTAGGIKISRIIIAWKNLKNEISSFVHPKRVQVIRLEGRKVGNDVVKSVNAYFVLYALLFIGSMFLICIENGSLGNV